MRTLLRTVLGLVYGSLVCSGTAAQPLGQAPAPAVPPPLRITDPLELKKEANWRMTLRADDRMDWWREARFGMFIHWGLYAIAAGEWGGKTTHGEWLRTTGQIPREEYEKFKERFNPTKFDARAWVKLAKAGGMKYVTITTKHHDGFCLFDSKETDWDVMSTPFKRDIIKEMADACREEGVKLCFYYSIMDWHHPDYTPRRDWETWDTNGADFDRYVAYMKAQLKELLTNYGPIGVLWFDGQWEGNWNDERGKDLYEYVRSLQPGIIINSRVGRAGGDWGLDGESDMLGDYATPAADHSGDLFFAAHGSWNSSKRVGYCIGRILFDDGKPYGMLKIVSTLDEKNQVLWARPVDCAQAPDGTIVFSSDQPGRLYRIRYVGPEKK